MSEGRIRQFDAHLDRFERSADLLELPRPDRAAWRRCAELAAASCLERGEISLTLVHTRGTDPEGSAPTAFAWGVPVSARRRDNRRNGISAITLDRGDDPDRADAAPWLLRSAKTLSYATNMAALRHAGARGADDAVFVTSGGAVLEGANSTVVAAFGRTLRTPPAVGGILPGTTQAALFRAARRAGWEAVSAPLRVEDLRGADGLFLTSATHRITWVRTLDGTPMVDARALGAELDALYDLEP
ncbi:aminotransferase class IV [Saccharopolyspora sp. CA-218241]|uniref:aminotransferase class IV n=1 Tax=Saccharopolyspora sp. CA-218241 TaxID=3240027 RepID=UPI003D976B4E